MHNTPPVPSTRSPVIAQCECAHPTDSRTHSIPCMAWGWNVDGIEVLVTSLQRGVRRSLQRGVRRSLQRGVRRSLQRGVRRSLQRGVKRSLQRGVRRSLQRGVKRSLQRSVRRRLQRGVGRSLQRGVIDRKSLQAKRVRTFGGSE